MQITTITRKGQVTIPKEIREDLGLKSGDKIAFRKEGNELRAVPAPDFFSFRGTLKGKKLPTEKEINEIVKKEAVERYKKTFK